MLRIDLRNYQDVGNVTQLCGHILNAIDSRVNERS